MTAPLLAAYTDSQEAPYNPQIEAIFMKMNKDTYEKQHIDCGCCGYDSCREMAIAIHNGFNHHHNCVHYIKDRAYEEKDRAVLLKEEVEKTQEEMRIKKDRLADEIGENFKILKESLKQIETERKTKEEKDASSAPAKK